MTATVYYYTPPHHVLKNLAEGRIKISSFSRCNDPFELAAFNMQRGARYDEHRRFRARIRDWQCRRAIHLAPVLSICSSEHFLESARFRA